MRVFVTGGTGLVGSRLVQQLLTRGDVPVVLSRRPDSARKSLGPHLEIVEGDPARQGPWMDRIPTCDGVIHLAGENVFARRWTDSFKQQLVDSRVQSSNNIASALKREPRRADGSPKVLISASAIGYYGPHGDEELTEEASPSQDFMGQLCVDWEKAARSAESVGIRTAQVRVGIVLDKEGGALAKLLTPFRMFVGGPVASGRQYMSWIHHEDLVSLFLFALDNPRVTGPLNGTAPNPVTNSEFSRSLGKALHRPSLVWTPGFALRILLGEAAAIVTSGQRVIPARPLALGYTFRYPTLQPALAQILSN
ncbi:MAG: TIGR01777 family oxidoreductase [Gemmataceae bacterium]